LKGGLIMRRSPRDRVENTVKKIVSLKAGINISKYEEEIKSQGGKIVERLPLINALLCEFPIHREGEVAGILENHPHVSRVESDLPIKIICFEPNFFFGRKAASAPKQIKQEIGWGVKRIAADAYLNIEPKTRIRVAVMDTGIQPNHPDLNQNIKGGINITGSPSDYSDPNGHGTHVAGIIGALNNDIGIVGVMPQTDLYAVKVFNSKGEGSLSDIIRGLQWCIDNKIKLVNMSFGSPTDNATFREVFKNAEKAGIIMVVAAGNDSNEHKIQYPAKYSETIAVSSLNKTNDISSFSSYGPEVNLIAPGEDILSTWNDGGYKTLSGTSMAAPHVTGAIAQMLNQYGDLTPAQVRQLLKTTTQRLPLKIELQGAGLIDVSKALKKNPKEIQYYRMVASYYGQ
jgi:hypothetical protein